MIKTHTRIEVLAHASVLHDLYANGCRWAEIAWYDNNDDDYEGFFGEIYEYRIRISWVDQEDSTLLFSQPGDWEVPT